MKAAIRSFLQGVGSILDIWGTGVDSSVPYHPDFTPEQKARIDAMMLRRDWEAIGRDMQTVLRAIDSQGWDIYLPEGARVPRGRHDSDRNPLNPREVV